MTTTLNDVMYALLPSLLPYGSRDMQFLADLCNKYSLDINQIVESVDENYPKKGRAFDRAEINIYIREALEQALTFCKSKIVLAIDIVKTSLAEYKEYVNTQRQEDELLLSTLQKLYKFLKDEGYDKIYTNCCDSGFDSEYITDGLLKCKNEAEIIEWVENQDFEGL